jgi:hypothetical protein
MARLRNLHQSLGFVHAHAARDTNRGRQSPLRRVPRWSEPEELPCDMVYPTDPAQGTRRHVAYIGEPCRLDRVSC